MNIGEKIAYLLKPETLRLLQGLCADARDELALAGALAREGIPAGRRQALLEQRALRLRAERKTSRAQEMIFTPLGLEQLTPEPLARYKAHRVAKAEPRNIADLCCGLGGDSLHMPAGVGMVGVDSEPALARAYLHNVSLWRGGAAGVAGAAESSPVRADVVLLDPARRRLAGRPARDESGLSPGWASIEEILRRHPHAALKLPPGANPPEFLADFEWEYLGLDDQCLELAVWTGRLGRPGMVAATELPGGASLGASRDEIISSFQEPREPGSYLFEPVKAVVRSHLFGVLGVHLNLWQIDGRLAYLSGAEPLRHPLLKGYRIIRRFGANWKEIQRELRRLDVGRLEVKKRGWNIGQEEVRARLRPQGEREATLLFVRVLGRKTVLLAEALGRGGS